MTQTAAITAYLRAREAQGFVEVPVEPTPEMMDAGLYQSSHDATWADVYSSWKDMLAARPDLRPEDREHSQ